MNWKLFLAGLLTASTVSIASEDCLNGGSEANTQEFQRTLSWILGGVNVSSISKAPVSGLYEIIIESNGRKIPIYADYNLKYLINGEIIDINKRINLTEERLQQLQTELNSEKESELAKILSEDKVEMLKREGLLEAIDIIDSKNIPKSNVSYGNGDIKIYIMTDPQCPFCAKLHEEIKKVLTQRKDVSFEMIMYPLPFHEYASGISQNIICQNDNSAKQEMLNSVFSYTMEGNESKLTSLEKSCDIGKQTIDNNLEYGRSNKINGVPTIIFPKGVAISGVIPADQLNKLIDILK